MDQQHRQPTGSPESNAAPRREVAEEGLPESKSLWQEAVVLPSGAPLQRSPLEQLANRTIPLDSAQSPPQPPRIRIVAPTAGEESPRDDVRDPPSPAPSPERPRAVVALDTHPPTLLQFVVHDEKTASRSEVTVLIPAEIREALVNHAEESGRRLVEVGGFLLGKVERVSIMNHQSLEPDGPVGYLVAVTDVYRIKSKNASVSHVRFGEGAWAQLNEECDRRFTPAGKVRLGWYHTHPNQGIFYSDQDLNSHLEWRRPYQIGLVIDPRNMLCGLFHWQRYPLEPDATNIRDYLANPLLFFLRSPRLLGPTSRPFGRGEGPRHESPTAPLRHPVPPPEESSLDVWAFVIVACFLAFVWGGLLFLNLHAARTVGASPARFDPTAILLAGLGAIYVLQRLLNAGAFRKETDPDSAPDSATDFLWWRFLAVFGVLVASGSWLSRCATVGRATTIGVFVVGGVLLLVELWMGRAFHQFDPLENRLTRSVVQLCYRGLESIAVGIIAGVKRGGSWIGRFLLLLFEHSVNVLTVGGVLVFGLGIINLFWLVLNESEESGITEANLLISVAIASGGVLLCLAGEELRRWLTKRQQKPRCDTSTSPTADSLPRVEQVIDPSGAETRKNVIRIAENLTSSPPGSTPHVQNSSPQPRSSPRVG